VLGKLQTTAELEESGFGSWIPRVRLGWHPGPWKPGGAV